MEAFPDSSQMFPPTLSSSGASLSLAFDQLNFSSSQHQLGLDLLQQVPSSADRQQNQTTFKILLPKPVRVQNDLGPGRPGPRKGLAWKPGCGYFSDPSLPLCITGR